MITDKQAAIDFNQSHPRQPGIGGMEPMFPEDIVDEMGEMEGWGGATLEMAIAFILEKYNAGISLLKKTNNGSFKKLKTSEEIDSNGNKTYRSNNCN